MDPNINNPNLDLSTPSIHLILDGAPDSDELTDKAYEELEFLKRVIQLHREQDARTQRAAYSYLVNEIAWGKSLDKLREEVASLKAQNAKLKDEVTGYVERDAGSSL